MVMVLHFLLIVFENKQREDEDEGKEQSEIHKDIICTEIYFGLFFFS